MKYTKDDIKRGLGELGILPSDTVLIHTSFKSLGEIEGSANAFLDAFCEYLSDGLFVVPTHTWANVNLENSTYMVNNTLPCIGFVPRTAAFRKDGIRSLHPTHSVWAHGKDAEKFTKGEETRQTPAPVGGSWWKLGERRAKILLIGVGLNRNTYIHAVDEIAELDDRLDKNSFNVTIIDENGGKTSHAYRPHGNTGSENFGNFEKPLTELGALTKGKLCDANVFVVDAAKCRDVLLRIYGRTKENLCLEKQDIPDCLWR